MTDFSKMTNENKVQYYDELIRISDKHQRLNNALKSEYVTDVPSNIQHQIDENNRIIDKCTRLLEKLFI